MHAQNVRLPLPSAAAILRPVERDQNIFSQVANPPAVQALLRRVEQGGASALAGVNVAAQPFVAALLSEHFPDRPIIVVTAGVKAQEAFHQDLATWLATEFKVQGPKSKVEAAASGSQPSTFNPQPLL